MSIWQTRWHRKIQNTVSKKHSPHTTQQTTSTQLQWVAIGHLRDHLPDGELCSQPLPSITGESQTPYYQPEKGSKSNIWIQFLLNAYRFCTIFTQSPKILNRTIIISQGLSVPPLKYTSCYPQNNLLRIDDNATPKTLHVINKVLITLVSVQKRYGRRDSSHLIAVVFHAWILIIK